MIKNLSLNEAHLTVQAKTLDGSDRVAEVEMLADDTWTFAEALEKVANSLGISGSQIVQLQLKAVSNPFVSLKYLSFGSTPDSFSHMRIYLASAA